LTDTRIDGRWDIALRDLEHAIGIDANGDGAITWREVRTAHDRIADYALSNLKIDAGGRDCTTSPTDQLIENHGDGAYTVIRFTAKCEMMRETIGLRYGLFFGLDPLHRGLLKVTHRDGVETAVLSPSRRVYRFEPNVSRWRLFPAYVEEGIWHIWIGFDHILFVLTLLLPALFVRRDSEWNSVSAGAAFGQILKLVTGFTAAHSVTLGLATYGLVSLPSRPVETAIAASVVLAAMNNIWPIVTRRTWVLAVGFGLIHGFGFAGVLSELGLPADALAFSLLGFNVGVEIGQIAIVGAALPALFLMRRWRGYTTVVLPFGSVAIAFVALMWFAERAFDLDVVGI